MKYDILLVDGPYLAHKSECAPFQVKTRDGRSATMMLTFMRTLNALRKQFKPKQIIVAWESHGTKSWRRELYPEYKPKKEVTDSFIEQLKDVQRLLCLFGVKQYTADNNEADDVIATISAQMNDVSQIIIFTVDKDIMQLINQNVWIWTGKEMFDSFHVKTKFGVAPKFIPDLLAIMGDSADNIKGVKGWGLKKTAKLLCKYGYIDEFGVMSPEMIAEIGPEIRYVPLLTNKKLTTLNKNCKLREYQIDGNFTKNQILDKYELNSIREKISEYNLLSGNRKRFW